MSVPPFVEESTKPPAKQAKAFTYKPQFAVVVLCDDETHQQSIYERLLAEGLRLKVVAV